MKRAPFNHVIARFSFISVLVRVVPQPKGLWIQWRTVSPSVTKMCASLSCDGNRGALSFATSSLWFELKVANLPLTLSVMALSYSVKTSVCY